MTPTIAAGEHIQIDMHAYRATQPRRWDIVLFNPPKYAVAPGQVDLGVWAFRVIGIPGDAITLEKDVFLVNGQEVTPPRTDNKIIYKVSDIQSRPEPAGEPVYPLVVPKGEFFVCGDNTFSANNSRYWGPIHASAIIGKVIDKK